MMTLFAKDGSCKIVPHLSFPATGLGCVTRIYSSLAVIDIENGSFVLREKLPSMSVEELQAVTGAEMVLPDVIGDLVAPEVS